MIVNEVNLAHCMRNVDGRWLLVDVLYSIEVQQEHKHYAALIYAKAHALGKWLTEYEVGELCSAYDKALAVRTTEQNLALANFNREQAKLVYVDGMALFKVEKSIDVEMTISELKNFIEKYRSGLGVNDLEQASGVLYKLALAGTNKIRVKNNV
ncbi:hypothetical protein R7M92_19725 [Vibrio sp. Vb2880]|uniref:hypothetical protein n=1 Tax=Vibrio TaxID=662 RepID=UPI00211A453D|nr:MULTISPECIES: hypothetical protein [Vibrio]MCQ9053037.1 hypothetical protein [Vibrio diabolicus]MDW1578004.1 hypothetical protein [Vibrio sp. Vb2880]